MKVKDYIKLLKKLPQGAIVYIFDGVEDGEASGPDYIDSKDPDYEGYEDKYLGGVFLR